jgi:hypothetical protein
VQEKYLNIVYIENVEMKDPEINFRVQQKLEEFEQMDRIYPSVDWNSTLMERINSVPQHSPAKYSIVRVNMLFLILILINVGFILTTLVNGTVKESNRIKDLQVVSHELLINPFSINN